jgi:prophage regulatory protein
MARGARMAARDEDDAAKWKRAEAIAAEDEAWRVEWERHCYNIALEDRFKEAGPAEVLRMFKDGVNDKGKPLSQFEFEALCERWCVVFGEPPPPGDPPADPEPSSPLPPDDAMLRMSDVVRITGLSKSTIKRWVADPENGFPKPMKLSPGRIGWRADQVKAWRKRIEDQLHTIRK